MIPVASQPEAVRVVLDPAQIRAELTETDSTVGALAGVVSSAWADGLIKNKLTKAAT
jgi:hypothetical protein